MTQEDKKIVYELLDVNERQELIKEIEKDISDLPRYEELAETLADFVLGCNWDYNLAQVAQVIDEFYGEGFFSGNDLGGSIGQDIKVLFGD